jgi:hypothetical protein
MQETKEKEIVTVETISKEERKIIKSAYVIHSRHGLSVCFTCYSGKRRYVPIVLEDQIKVKEGFLLQLSDIQLITHHSPQSQPYQRVHIIPNLLL